MYAIIPGVALALGGPALVLATMAQSWAAALPLFGVTLGLSVFYLAPSVAAIQALAPAGERSTASAIMLLCLNLIGLGGGPVFIGMVSDWAMPVHATESLRIAFFALAPMFLIAAAANVAAARALGKATSAS
jgi:hypothetical protein